MKRKTFIAVTILYSLLLAHFLFSNFVKVVGPNYALKSSMGNAESSGGCPPSGMVGGVCFSSCPLYLIDQAAPNAKGFPFQTNNPDSSCGALAKYAKADFTKAIALNILYIVTLTALYASFARKTNTKKKLKV